MSKLAWLADDYTMRCDRCSLEVPRETLRRMLESIDKGAEVPRLDCPCGACLHPGHAAKGPPS